MKHFILFIFISTLIISCKDEKPHVISKVEPIRIAFGSCAHENKPQPLLDIARNMKPDAFVFLGDNIYGDSRNMDTLKMKYDKLFAKPEHRKLRDEVRAIATWDDHDYGENDAGRYYPMKAESKKIFLDFWNVADDANRRKRPGIYDTEYIEKGGKKIQFIILDTRTFRDDLIHRKKDNKEGKNDYLPNQSPDSTFLGADQWRWLEGEFKKPADMRIICSSNQFSHEYNGWESWTNVPHEQQKMIDLITSTKANGVIFISGDVHWGEISKRPVDGGYPIYDVTSSGITQTWPDFEPNKYRVGNIVTQNNFGLITIDGDDVSLELYDITGKPQVTHRIKNSDLVVR